MKNTQELSTTLEDYLEAILEVSRQSGVARSKEIAEHLKVKGSSVTVAMRSLTDKGLITYTPYSYIQLTEEGRRIASCIANRHSVLKKFFTEILRLTPLEAESAACSMEHGLSPKLCDRISHLSTLIEASSEFQTKLTHSISHTHPDGGCSSNCKCS